MDTRYCYYCQHCTGGLGQCNRQGKRIRIGKAEISVISAGDMIVVVENHDQLSVFPACTLPMNSEPVYSIA